MRRRKRLFVSLLALISILCVQDTACVHLTGTFSSREFFRFLIKFGFQKTDKINDETTQGYIYGNLTLENNVGRLNDTQVMKFLVVDAQYFANVYQNSPAFRRVAKRTCQRMFSQVADIAFDARCKPRGTEDFMRTMPCPHNELCEEEDTPERVFPGYQFTFRVQDVHQARFWYVSLVSCHLDAQCNWQGSEVTFANPGAGGSLEDVRVRYDVWLVNGNPNSSHLNPFEHQFSFEQHDVAEIYLAFLAVFLVATCVQAHACTRLRMHWRRAISHGQNAQRQRTRSLSQSQSSSDQLENSVIQERYREGEASEKATSSGTRSSRRMRSASCDRFTTVNASSDGPRTKSIARTARHLLGKIFVFRNILNVNLVCLIAMDVSLVLNLIHSLVYAFNGCGVVAFSFLANCLQLMSECIFMILLGLVARGWYVDRPALPFKNRTRFTLIVVLYLVANVALEVWSFATLKPIEDVDEYQTSAFIAELALRLITTCFFLYSVWRTSRDGVLAQADGELQDFFYQFAAGYLVYFIYLPFMILICVQYVSALWRMKTIMSVRYSMNVLAYASMLHVMWPSRRPAFFIFQKDYEQVDDVEASWLSSDSETTPSTTSFARNQRSSKKPLPLRLKS